MKHLRQMGDLSDPIYTDTQKVKQQIPNASFILQKGKFSGVIVNNKPIETTANEILGLIYDRFSDEEREHKPFDVGPN